MARRGWNTVAGEVVLADGAAVLQTAGMAAPGQRRRLAWHRCSAPAPYGASNKRSATLTSAAANGWGGRDKDRAVALGVQQQATARQSNTAAHKASSSRGVHAAGARVEAGRSWRGSMAARGGRGDEAMARAFKQWVRLTGGPSPLFI
jgi:hypothetical protein